MEDGIFTYYMDMPPSIRSFVVENNDLTFTIVINSRIGREQQLKAYRHEINHIKNNDCDKDCSVDAIELSAHSVRDWV
mgnify:CR=1 FL=1